ncbi:MAG: prolipoprotein diacylglyceryl transferase [Spirochaetales bacterium]|nr:prolipoprotein diacylglyceryl transferase [Spirochaetales bacterium]
MLNYFDPGKWISPEIIPGLPFRWYALMYILAFGTSYLLFVFQVKKRKLAISNDEVLNFFTWGILGLLIGARLFGTLIFANDMRYWQEPWMIIWPFEGSQFVGLSGMNYYGGVIGGIAGLLIYAKIKKIDMLEWSDMLCAGLPLGYTFGRLGNWINAELYGRVTTAPWGVVFPGAQEVSTSKAWVQDVAAKIGMNIQDMATVNLPRHPTQIYEGFLEGLLLWAVIWFIFRNRKPFKGFIVGFYILGYGFFRFLMDYFRMPVGGANIDYIFKGGSPDATIHLLTSPFNIIKSQIFSLAMVIGAVVFLIIMYNQHKASEQGESGEDKKVSTRRLRKKIK